MSKSIVLAFITGAAIGSVATWLAVREYYYNVASEEAEEIRAHYYSKYKASEEEDAAKKAEEERAAEEERQLTMMEYAAQLHHQGYTNYSNSEGKPGSDHVPPTEKTERPYVIAPEEFGDIEGYEKISLTYYEDQVLADENDELVDDVEDAIGFDSLLTFGKYEDDSVFVRNDARKCDFEILKDYRRYSDVVKNKPHPTEAR